MSPGIPPPPHTHSYVVNFNILKINQFYSYRLVSIYRSAVIYNNTVLFKIVKSNQRVPPYPKRHPETWALPNIKTSYGNQSFLYNLPDILNQLSNNNIIAESSTNNELLKIYISMK